jgi:hypothetical protein
MAYVARGQGEVFWMSHVESLTPILQKHAAEFGALLTSTEARSTFETATGALENFRTLDAKIRQAVQSGSALFAADMIFSDGLESMATASTQLAAALTQELQHRSESIASVHNRQLANRGRRGRRDSVADGRPGPLWATRRPSQRSLKRPRRCRS